MGRIAERWTPGLARQVREALSCGTCTEAQVAAAERLEVWQLRVLLERFPVPPASAPQVELDVASPASADAPAGGRRRRRHDVAAMHAEYEAGATLEQVGALRGLTRERVRHLFVEAGLPTRDIRAYRQLQRLRALAAAEPLAEDIVLAWQAGGSPRVIANRLGLRTTAVEQVIDAHADELDRRMHRANAAGGAPGPVKATRERCVACVREAAEILGRTPTSAEYGDLAAQRPQWPAAVTIAVTWGWRATLEAAGLVERRRSFRAPRSDRVSIDVCWQAVRRVADEVGRIPTCEDYARASKGRDDLPSLAVVRRRLGGWRAMLAAWPGPAQPGPDPHEEMWDTAARCVRSAADILGRVPSCTEYDDLARDAGWMRSAFIVRRFGWSATVERAGLEPRVSTRAAA
jgi:hypothetical protein